MKEVEFVKAEDLAALGVVLGVSMKILPALAALLAVVYYGFVIYDRIRYGPELERRMLRHTHKRRKEKEDEEG